MISSGSSSREIVCINNSDEQGNPTDGYVGGTGLSIRWQNGPLREPDGTSKELDGTTVELVIQAVLQRLQFYSGGPFRCRENSLAITHLEEGLHWLQARTADRVNRGVEGTNVP